MGLSMADSHSNYTIAEQPRSFLIEAGLRDLVYVEQTETGFLVRTPAEVQLTLFDLSSEDDLEPKDDSTAIGFFEYQVLVNRIVSLLFADWVKRNGEGVAPSQRERMRAKIRKSVEKPCGSRGIVSSHWPIQMSWHSSGQFSLLAGSTRHFSK